MFTMFRASVCGAELFANYTSNWPAVVRTSGSCLSLPAEAFDHLVAWLPVDCDLSSASQSTPPCVVREPAAATAQLPWMWFRLSEDGPPVYLRLADLVYQTSEGGVPTYRMCLLRGRGFVASMQIMSPELGAVVLGTMALRSLYVALDVDAKRIGFANKGTWATGTVGGAPPGAHLACEPLPVCRGQQVLYTPRRVCMLPACNDYFFQTVDEDTMECKFKLSFIVWAVTAIAAALALEVTSLTCKKRFIGQFARRRGGGGGTRAARAHARQSPPAVRVNGDGPQPPAFAQLRRRNAAAE